MKTKVNRKTVTMKEIFEMLRRTIEARKEPVKSPHNYIFGSLSVAVVEAENRTIDAVLSDIAKVEAEYGNPKNNADRIRNMTDEELAEFLPIVSNCLCRPTDECLNTICNRGECVKTKECALKWLRAENTELGDVSPKTVYAVLEHMTQTNYTESRYYTCAKDSSEIVCIFDDSELAYSLKDELEKEESERRIADHYDEENDDIRYFSVETLEMNCIKSAFRSEKGE